jgi:probable rRNA maturation factor
MGVRVIDQRGAKVDPRMKRILRRLVKAVLEWEGVSSYQVNLALVGMDQIQELNRSFRGIDAPTDVLSFPLQGGSRVVGDVVICVPQAIAQAREFGHSLAREMAYLAVHGTLHLLGYDHERTEERAAVRAREELFLARFGLTR